MFSACRQQPDVPPYTTEKSALGDTCMVVAEHPLAAKVGLDILKAGGNAIDAAIASQFALAVVYPRAGNIGGGGFMVIRMAGGETASIDYREMAPGAAYRTMFQDNNGEVIPGKSKEGHLAVGVPGTVAGMEAAFKRYSRVGDWKQLLTPAIRLARDGFVITQSEADRLNTYRDLFVKHNRNAAPFVKTGAWRMGDRLVQEDLARTLQRIADLGAKGFYAGETAALIVAEMERGGGLINLEDLQQYEVKWREPIICQYKNYSVITMPPASSGGVALCQILEMIEPYPVGDYGFQSVEAVHLITEAERRAFADRAEYLGDSDFYPVPVDSLLDTAYLLARMANFDRARASVSDSVDSKLFRHIESFETTHTSIVDGDGNAVSVTTTLNLNYGSKVLVEGAGFFLNDQMDDFSAKPGVPNFFGLIGTEANAIQPGKRMLSSMTPTIIEKDGNLWMVLGAPGGPTIITAVLQTILNVVEYEMPLDEAVAASRFHHQFLPDEIQVEPEAIDTATRKQLREMGHQLRQVNRMALIKAVQVLPGGQLHGAADPRNPDDHATGF